MATNTTSHFLKRASKISWPERVINWVLILTFFILPLFFINISWQGANLDKLFFLGLLVIIGWVVWLIKVLKEGALTWHWRKLDWLVLAILVVSAVATFWSPSWHNSFFGGYGQPMRSLIFLVLLVLLYFLAVNNWSAKLRRSSWLAILISFSFITIYSLCQLLGFYIIPLSFTRTISFNPIGSLSNLALFLAATLPLFIIALGSQEEFCERPSSNSKLWWNIWLILTILANIAAIVILGSFNIWPVVILGLLIVLIFAISHLIKFTPLQLGFSIGMLIISFVLLIVGNIGWPKVNLPSEVSLSRGFSWQIAQASLAKRPIFGNGLASFDNAFSRFKSPDFNAAALWNLDFDVPTGWLAESLVIVGGLGSLLIVIGLVWALVLAGRRLLSSKTELPSADLKLGASLGAAVIVIIIGGLFIPVGNNLLLILGLLWILFMVVTYNWPRRRSVIYWRKADERANAGWIVGFIAVAIFLLASLAYGVKIYAADILAAQSIKSQTTDQQIITMSQAYNLAPWREMYGFGLAQLSWIKANELAQAAMTATGTPALEAQTAAKSYAQQAKAILDQVSKLVNNQPANLKMAASLYEMIGDFEGAMATHQRLIELDPNNPWPYAKLAQLKVVQAYQAQDKETKDKLVEEALSGYAKALELKPDWAEAYYYRAVLYQAIEKPVEATQDLVLAVNNSGGATNYVLPLAQLLNERAKIETDSAANLRAQAQQLVEGVLATDDSNVNALYILAMIYRDSGQTDLARETVNKLLDKAQEADKPFIEQQFADLLAK
ncbi:hypothetical protein KBI31_01825 [Patescibacteria group bacterium]|nr:hypothetical protein [Patescibacteria group bacterium]